MQPATKKLNAAFQRRVSATKLFNKPPLAILNGTSNPIGLHNEHSLFKEYRYIFTTTWKQASTSHLSSRLTDNASGKLLIIFILSYLFVLPTSFLRIPKAHNRTSLQVWIQMYCTFVLFVNQHFPGLPASGTHCIRMRNMSELFTVSIWLMF
jgi:hypothetical protein